VVRVAGGLKFIKGLTLWWGRFDSS